MRKILMLVAVLAFAGACDKTTEPAPTVTGAWSGSGGGITMSLSLTQAGQAVTGTGSMSSSGGAVAVSANGNFSNPSLSVTLSAAGYEDSNFAGTLSGNTMTGILNGSGFNQVGMTLTRK